jgi:hypothetical protein
MKKNKYTNVLDSTKIKSFCTNASLPSTPLKSIKDTLHIIEELKNTSDSLRKIIRKKKIAHQMQFDSLHKHTLYNSYVGFKNIYLTSNNTEGQIAFKSKVTDEGATIPCNTFYETIKACKSLKKENLTFSRHRSDEGFQNRNLYESIEGKLVGLNDPIKTATSRGLFEKSKEKFFCRYLMDTKKEKIIRYNEDCENAITKIQEDIKEYNDSKRLLENFVYKYDDFMKNINEKREIEREELFKLRLTYKKIDKQTYNVNLAMNKIERDIIQGNEYRNFLIMVKEKTLELPKFMLQLVDTYQIQNNFSQKLSKGSYNKSTPKSKCKKGFSFDLSLHSTNNEEIEKYYRYITNENIFKTTEEFIDIFTNLEDENLRLLTEYHKQILIKKQLLLEINRKCMEDKKLEDNEEDRKQAQEKVMKLRQRNEQLKHKRETVIKQKATNDNVAESYSLITTNDKNITRMIADVTGQIEKYPELVKGRHFILNKHSNDDIVRLGKIEFIADALQHEICEYERDDEYRKFIQSYKEKLQLRTKVKKTEHQKKIIMLKKQKITDSIINKSHKNVARNVRRFDRRFRPKAIKIKVDEENSCGDNYFYEMINYEDNN